MRHSNEAIAEYPDRFVMVFAGEALSPSVDAERTAFDVGRRSADAEIVRLRGTLDRIEAMADSDDAAAWDMHQPLIAALATANPDTKEG